MPAKFSDISPDIDRSAVCHRTISLLSSGGDARIELEEGSGLNRYMSAPYPRDVIAFASSTANDISAHAFAHALGMVERGLPAYDEHLDQLRSRVKAAYSIDQDCDIVFAPSGTDLEFVALAAANGRREGGIHNILLGADEVGRGCIHSAHGNFFADETALGYATRKGDDVAGLEQVSLADIPVRCEEGRARSSREITDMIRVELDLAQQMDRHALVHVVHGSKTGLILPDLAALDLLVDEYGDGVTFVIDACQGRIMTDALKAYLDRGAIVFLTGSKFFGGPPFSGIGILPGSFRCNSGALPPGFAKIFRQAEWPGEWLGAADLETTENPGLGLRLEVSIHELERFQQLPMEQVERVIAAFQVALHTGLLEPFGFTLVEAYSDDEPDEHPLEMLTLATINVSAHPLAKTFDDAAELHRRLAFGGIRLGQPVKSVRTLDGYWGGTLRVGLSMPQMVALAELEGNELHAELNRKIAQIGEALTLHAAER